MIRSTTILLATLASFAFSLSAQQSPEGYSNQAASLPSGAGQVLTTASGTVFFTGTELVLDNGFNTQTLLTFASSTFGSFTAPIGSTRVLFGESSNGGVWSVALDGSGAQLITNLTFNYDAVLLDDDRALVSAKTGGFAAANNDVVFVDLLTGQTQTVAQFPGASGALAIDDAGDVYYATASSQYPAPPGSTDVLRISRGTVDAAIANNQILGVNDATFVVSGLDAAGDMAFDDDGDLFYVDWFNGAIGEINDADTAQATVGPAIINYAGAAVSPGGLQFVPTASPVSQVFEPFQAAGGTLRVYETDYVSIAQQRVLRAARPALTTSVASPIPAGTFALDVSSGPAGGFAIVVLATTTATGPLSVSVPGYEAPLLIDASLATAPMFVGITLDAAGAGSLALNNPGFAPALNATAQAVVVSANGSLGSTAAETLQVSN